jgi:formylglycine-generating enzyme required for sulfatase activity
MPMFTGRLSRLISVLRRLVAVLGLLGLLVLLISCPLIELLIPGRDKPPDDQNPPVVPIDDPDDPDDPQPPAAVRLTDSAWWGYWVRSDRRETWYVSDASVTNQSVYPLTSHSIASWDAAASTLLAGPYSMVKHSANIIAVNDGAFHLYRQTGAGALLTGAVAGMDGRSVGMDGRAVGMDGRAVGMDGRAVGMDGRSVGMDGRAVSVDSQTATSRRALTIPGIGAIRLVIANTVNAANAAVIEPDASGSFTMPTIIPGDTYTVRTIVESDTGQSNGPSLATTLASGVNELGIITVLGGAGTFKVDCPRSDLPWAYAQGGGYYDYHDYEIIVRSLGMETEHQLSLSIQPEPDFWLAVDERVPFPVQLDGSLAIGGMGGAGRPTVVGIPIRVSCPPLAEEVAYKQIDFTLRSEDGSVWHDTAALKFYREDMQLEIVSLGGRVSGHVFSPEEDGIWFNTWDAGGGRYRAVIEIPFVSRGYSILVSRGPDTELVRYSIGIAAAEPVPAADDAAIRGWAGPYREPNNAEDQAWPVAFGEVLIDTLDASDFVDFFDIGGKAPAPVISMASGTYHQPVQLDITCLTDTADIYWALDDTDPAPGTGVRYTGSFILDRSATLKVRAWPTESLAPVQPPDPALPFSALQPSGPVQPSDIIQAEFLLVCLPVELLETEGGAWQASCASAGSTIRYSRDGTVPQGIDAGLAYDPRQPPVPQPGGNLIFRAFKAGWEASPPAVQRGPFASFTRSATVAAPGETVHFDASATFDPTTPAGDIELLWDFGDGTTTDWSSDRLVSHSYASGGLKQVRLQARNSYNLIGEATGRILVPASTMAGKGLELVRVPGGSFTMGDSPVWDSNGPSHTVTLDDYYLSRYELTQDQYDDLMGRPINLGPWLGDMLPVYAVNWYDAIAFCNRLSLADGLEPVYSYAGYGSDSAGWPSGWRTTDHNNISCDWNRIGYRLPTEAEWEYAAGAGLSSRVYTYAGGNNPDTVGWHAGNSALGDPPRTQPHPVGQKLPNGLGLYDMSGNAREWCWDWYTWYTTDPLSNPRGPDSPVQYNYKVCRGRSWEAHYSGMAVYWRDSNYPSHAGGGHGFRLALSIPGQ